MAKYMRKPSGEVLVAFLRSDYYSTMADVPEQVYGRRQQSFNPAYPVSCGGATSEEQQERLRMLKDAQTSDAVQVDDAISDELTRMLGSMAPEVKSCLRNSFESDYREKRYYVVLAKIIRDRKETTEATSVCWTW